MGPSKLVVRLSGLCWASAPYCRATGMRSRRWRKIGPRAALLWWARARWCRSPPRWLFAVAATGSRTPKSKLEKGNKGNVFIWLMMV